MDVLELAPRWDALRLACQRHGATGRWTEGKSQPPRLNVATPATEVEVAEVERQLGLAIPPSFRRMLLAYSARVDIQWQLPHSTEIEWQSQDSGRPGWYHQIWAGECRWDLYELVKLQAIYKGWLADCWTDPDDWYGGVWYNKFPFLEVGNGDLVAIEMGVPDCEAVVFLSHDDGEGHGYWLGADFEDYVDRLSRLGCPGAEDDGWIVFTAGSRSLLLPDGDNARQWRDWFGLSLP